MPRVMRGHGTTRANNQASASNSATSQDVSNTLDSAKLTSAYAEFAEHDKGSLEPGKLADLAVLSQDILSVPADAIRETKALMTVVGGKVVYRNGI